MYIENKNTIQLHKMKNLANLNGRFTCTCTCLLTLFTTVKPVYMYITQVTINICSIVLTTLYYSDVQSKYGIFTFH